MAGMQGLQVSFSITLPLSLSPSLPLGGKDLSPSLPLGGKEYLKDDDLHVYYYRIYDILTHIPEFSGALLHTPSILSQAL